MTGFLIMYLIFSPIILSSIIYFASNKMEYLRENLSIAMNALELLAIILLACFYTKENLLVINILGVNLSFKVDAFRIIYAFISSFLWMNTTAFSKEYMAHYEKKDRYYFFYALTLSGVMGVFLSNDLFTLYCFFEIMSLASYPLVIHDEKEESLKAGAVYLSIVIATGMILLMGLFILYAQIGDVTFDAIREYVKINGISKMTYAAGILALIGFGAKVGAFPLHIWLPKAYPVAPAPASALLSGILTKCGVFGIIIISSNIFFANYSFGILVLIIAILTMFVGAILALFSNNLKKTLACSSMSQIGFILVGISFYILLKDEGALAAQGTLMYMMNHSIFKLVLFMCAGVIAMNIHELDLNKIRGYGRKKPFIMVIFLVGALGIMGIPLFSGYASKTLIHESIVEYINVANLSSNAKFGFRVIEWIFLFSSGLTIAYMSKLFICIFVEKNENDEVQKTFDDNKKYMSLFSKCIFVLSSIAIILIGILPNIIGIRIVSATGAFFNLDYTYTKISFFSFENLKGSIISIVFGVVIYFVIVKKVLMKNNTYLDLWPKKLDLEYLFYRPIFVDLPLLIILYVLKYVVQFFDFIIFIFRKTILKDYIYRPMDSNIAYRIGAIIDNIKKPQDKDYYANSAKTKFEQVVEYLQTHTSNFSFAFAMICIGLIVIIAFALLS